MGTVGRPLETILYVDAQLALVDDMLHYFDRASMAHSLEVRVPFLDHHLVEHCATIPDRPQGPRPDHGTPAQRAAKRILPDQVIEKRRSASSSGRSGSGSDAQAGGAIEEYLLTDVRPAVGDFVDPATVGRLVRDASGDRAATAARVDPDARGLAARLPSARDGRRRPGESGPASLP